MFSKPVKLTDEGFNIYLSMNGGLEPCALACVAIGLNPEAFNKEALKDYRRGFDISKLSMLERIEQERLYPRKLHEEFLERRGDKILTLLEHFCDDSKQSKISWEDFKEIIEAADISSYLCEEVKTRLDQLRGPKKKSKRQIINLILREIAGDLWNDLPDPSNKNLKDALLRNPLIEVIKKEFKLEQFSESQLDKIITETKPSDKKRRPRSSSKKRL